MVCTLEGINLYYEIEGEGNPVVFLHGWGSNSQAFNCISELIKDKYKVIKLDFPGFGKSDMVPNAWSVDDYVRITIKFIKYLELKEINLVGHSFGGRVIIKMNSIETPFEIAHIILMDSAGILPPKSLKKTLKIKSYKIGKKVLGFGLIKIIFPDALEKFKKNHGSADYKNASGALRDTMVRVVNEDLRENLKDVKAPTLLIWGDKDDATPIRDAHIMEKEIPNAGLYIIEGAGHFSFLKNPYVVAEAMKRFF